jgi:hypothetical protein
VSEHSDHHSERDPDAAEQQSGEQAREQYDGGTDGEPYAAVGQDVERGESRRQHESENEGDTEEEEPHADSASPSADQAKQREREMEESGEESPG